MLATEVAPSSQCVPFLDQRSHERQYLRTENNRSVLEDHRRQLPKEFKEIKIVNVNRFPKNPSVRRKHTHCSTSYLHTILVIRLYEMLQNVLLGGGAGGYDGGRRASDKGAFQTLKQTVVVV